MSISRSQVGAAAPTHMTAKRGERRGRRGSSPSMRRVDRAYYWMVVRAAVVFAVFLYVPFAQGIAYSFTNSQGYGDFSWIGL